MSYFQFHKGGEYMLWSVEERKCLLDIQYGVKKAFKYKQLDVKCNYFYIEVNSFRLKKGFT